MCIYFLFIRAVQSSQIHIYLVIYKIIINLSVAIYCSSIIGSTTTYDPNQQCKIHIRNPVIWPYF